MGEIIKILKEEAEFVTIRREEEVSKIQTTVSCACAEQACGLYVEQETFPPRKSGGQGHLPGEPIPTAGRGRSTGSQ